MKLDNNPKICVVTPIHNGLDHTLSFLASLEKVDYQNFEVIIVDDGSTDGSAESIKHKFPKTIVLKGDGNLWWSGATNMGVREAQKLKADFVFTVNNDVTVDQGVFSALVRCHQDNPNSLVGCKIYYMHAPDKVWYFGADLNNEIADIKIYYGEDKEFTEKRKVGVLTGMGVLVPIRVYDAIGYYDIEHLPQYFADSDFALRAGEAGFTCMVDPDCKIYSDVDSSWVNNKLKNPRLVFLWECLFADRSPYSLKVRYYFYKRHWGKNYLRILAKFYVKFTYHFVIRGFGPAYARKKFHWLKPAYRKLKGVKPND